MGTTKNDSTQNAGILLKSPKAIKMNENMRLYFLEFSK